MTTSWIRFLSCACIVLLIAVPCHLGRSEDPLTLPPLLDLKAAPDLEQATRASDLGLLASLTQLKWNRANLEIGYWVRIDDIDTLRVIYDHPFIWLDIVYFDCSGEELTVERSCLRFDIDEFLRNGFQTTLIGSPPTSAKYVAVSTVGPTTRRFALPRR